MNYDIFNRNLLASTYEQPSAEKKPSTKYQHIKAKLYHSAGPSPAKNQEQSTNPTTNNRTGEIRPTSGRKSTPTAEIIGNTNDLHYSTVIQRKTTKLVQKIGQSPQTVVLSTNFPHRTPNKPNTPLKAVHYNRTDSVAPTNLSESPSIPPSAATSTPNQPKFTAFLRSELKTKFEAVPGYSELHGDVPSVQKTRSGSTSTRKPREIPPTTQFSQPQFSLNHEDFALKVDNKKLMKLARFEEPEKGQETRNCKDITRIIATHQRWLSLPAALLQNCPGLQYLDLSFNNLSNNLTNNIVAFTNWPNLVQLRLVYNHLSSLPVGIFNLLANLQSLSLDNNQISSLNQLGLHHCHKLSHFSAANNRLSDLSAADLPQNCLNSIDLSHNSLSSAQFLADFPNIQVILLNQNRILAHSLPNISHLGALEELQLNSNGLNSLKQLNSSQSLAVLHANDNDLARSSDFPVLNSLTELRIRSNQLDFPEIGILLANLPHLELLDCNNNPISSHFSLILQELKQNGSNLTDLYILDNEIFHSSEYSEIGAALAKNLANLETLEGEPVANSANTIGLMAKSSANAADIALLSVAQNDLVSSTKNQLEEIKNKFHQALNSKKITHNLSNNGRNNGDVAAREQDNHNGRVSRPSTAQLRANRPSSASVATPRHRIQQAKLFAQRQYSTQSSEDSENNGENIPRGDNNEREDDELGEIKQKLASMMAQDSAGSSSGVAGTNLASKLPKAHNSVQFSLNSSTPFEPVDISGLNDEDLEGKEEEESSEGSGREDFMRNSVSRASLGASASRSNLGGGSSGPSSHNLATNLGSNLSNLSRNLYFNGARGNQPQLSSNINSAQRSTANSAAPVNARNSNPFFS
jgi:Leucine-rich repeat (LRR) protein